MTAYRRAWILAVDDAVALLLFVVLGNLNHQTGLFVESISRTALPLLLAWFLVALVAKTYLRPNAWTLLRTWFPAITIGVLARYAWLRRPDDVGELAVFWAVALMVTLVLLVAWRFVASRVVPPIA